jgi:phospholipid transport system substrate-binding protein
MKVRVAAVVAIVILTGAAGAAPAANDDEAQAVIRKTVDDAFAVLKDKALARPGRRADRIAALRRVADRVFDWAEMARSSLGVHWRSLDERKRAQFAEVFKDVLAGEYTDDIDKFQGSETVTVTGSSADGDQVVVKTTLTTASRERVPIDYRMRKQRAEWKVIDVSIEGVSLVNHFRQTFSNALANMTVDQLITRLEGQLPPGR